MSKAVRAAHARVAALARHRPGTAEQSAARMVLIRELALEQALGICQQAPPVTAEMLTLCAYALLSKAVRMDAGEPDA